MSDYDSEDSDELELRRKLEELENKKVELSAEDILREKLKKERENIKYWAPILLLYPLGPVCIAISTIVIVGIVINVSNDKCNSNLPLFLQGAVALSYVLLLFYSYCWLGPKPIKSLRSLKIFYSIYGFICFAWWGIYGTLQGSLATNSGLNNCLQTSPGMYIAAAYEIAIFWIFFGLFVSFALRELVKVLVEKDQYFKERAKVKREAMEAAMEEEAKAAADDQERLDAEEEAEDKAKQAKQEKDNTHESDEDENESGDEDDSDDDEENDPDDDDESTDEEENKK